LNGIFYQQNWAEISLFSWFWITLPKNHLTEIFWPKAYLTETPFDRTPFDRMPFDRMPFDRKFIWPNRRLTERRLTESSFYRKVIWPIFFSENGHLTESSFDKNVTWPKKNCAQGRLAESLFDRKLFFEKWSHEIRILHVPNFFVTARRHERKKMFLYCHCYYSNRVENMIKVTDCNELENLAELYIFIRGTAPGGDEDIWAIKPYSGRMQNQKWEKLFWF
jgi:hypothetical protein